MNASVSIPSVFNLRPEAEQAPTSGIVDVFTYGRGRPGIIPLWVGEGDLSTPDFICEAAARSLKDGETFYTYQRGIPELRQAIARYHEQVYAKPFDVERFFVTSGGMPAMQIAFRMTSGPGDEVLIPTPAWPNFVGAITIAGARPVAVPMEIDERGWRLDLERLEQAITPRRLRGRVDLLTGQIPYVPPEEIDDLPTEVREHEPVFTLTDQSDDGLGLVRQAVAHAPDWLAPGGWLELEISEDFGTIVEEMCWDVGLVEAGVVSDDDKLSVVVEARKPLVG